MSQAPSSVADSSAVAAIGPYRDSFLRHLAAENRSPSTLTTYGAAIDLLAAFVGDVDRDRHPPRATSSPS